MDSLARCSRRGRCEQKSRQRNRLESYLINHEKTVLPTLVERGRGFVATVDYLIGEVSGSGPSSRSPCVGPACDLQAKVVAKEDFRRRARGGETHIVDHSDGEQ